MATPSPRRPITVALVDDYDVVLIGLAHMLDHYEGRIAVVELDANEPISQDVDIVLYDSFAQAEADAAELRVLTDHPRAGRVAVYTWNFEPALIEQAMQKGASAYLSKALPARDLVAALEAVHQGETVISAAPGRAKPALGLDWPGRSEGLTGRQAEVLALITQGKSNAEIAALTFLSPNSVKAYIRAAYQKIGVTSRTQAVIWGMRNGFSPDHDRLAHWRRAQ
jgi:DNA-binding NarL/FixJ family response regulator